MILNTKEEINNYLIIGNYYRATNCNHDYIFKILSKECYGNKGIYITKNTYNNSFGRIGENYNFYIRLATLSEIQHLDACIKANKYVEPIKELQYEIY